MIRPAQHCKDVCADPVVLRAANAGVGTAAGGDVERVRRFRIHPCKAVVLYSCCENGYNSCPEEMSPVVVSL